MIFVGTLTSLMRHFGTTAHRGAAGKVARIAQLLARALAASGNAVFVAPAAVLSHSTQRAVLDATHRPRTNTILRQMNSWFTRGRRRTPGTTPMGCRTRGGVFLGLLATGGLLGGRRGELRGVRARRLWAVGARISLRGTGGRGRTFGMRDHRALFPTAWADYT